MSKHIKTIQAGPYKVTKTEEDGRMHIFVRMIGYSASAAAVENGSPLVDDNFNEHEIKSDHLPSVLKAIDELDSEPYQLLPS